MPDHRRMPVARRLPLLATTALFWRVVEVAAPTTLRILSSHCACFSTPGILHRVNDSMWSFPQSEGRELQSGGVGVPNHSS